MLGDLGALVVVELDLVGVGQDVGGLPGVAAAELVLDLAHSHDAVASDRGGPDTGRGGRLAVELAPARGCCRRSRRRCGSGGRCDRV